VNIGRRQELQCQCVQDGNGDITLTCANCLMADEQHGEPLDDGHHNGSADEKDQEYERDPGDTDTGDDLPPFGSPAMNKEMDGTWPEKPSALERAVTLTLRDMRSRVRSAARAVKRKHDVAPSDVPLCKRVKVPHAAAGSEVVALHRTQSARLEPAAGPRGHSHAGRPGGSRQTDAQSRGHADAVEPHRDGKAAHNERPGQGGRLPAAAAAASDGPGPGLMALAVEDEAKARLRGISFVFTINLPLDITRNAAMEAAVALEGWLEDSNKVKQYAYQLEQGEGTQRYHIQGWLSTHHQCVFRTVHAIFPEEAKAWVRKARGTPQQCWDYCTKDDTRVDGPWTKGERPVGAGKRNDLKDFVEAAKGLATGDMTLKQLEEDHVPIEARYMKYFDRVVTREQPDRSRPTLCTLAYGPPATGKTTGLRRRAEEEYPGAEIYYLPLKEHDQSNQWWDMYKGQEVIIIEDASPGFMKQEYFLRLIDRTPLLVQTKGNYRKFLGRHVYISSNYSLDGLFPFTNPAVSRRITTIFETEYHPDHQLPANATEEQSVRCALNAVWHRRK